MTATSALCTCGRPTGDDAFICSACADDYAKALGLVPGLAHELIVTMSKQQRFGDSALIAYRANGLPYDVGAADSLHRLRAELVALVRLCLDDKVRSSDYRQREPEDTLRSMSRWLQWRVDGLAAMRWAPEALTLIAIVEQAEAIIDRPLDRTYAGPCDDCSRDLYVEHGQMTVICDHCGATYDLKARRTWLLHVVDDRLATAGEIARALSSLDMPITHDLIRQWRHRGRLTPRSHDKHGVPTYRVGDVIALLHERTAEAQARADRRARG